MHSVFLLAGVSIGTILCRNGKIEVNCINISTIMFQLGHFFAEMERIEALREAPAEIKFQLGHFFAEMERLRDKRRKKHTKVFQLGHFFAEMESL